MDSYHENEEFEGAAAASGSTNHSFNMSHSRADCINGMQFLDLSSQDANKNSRVYIHIFLR